MTRAAKKPTTIANDGLRYTKKAAGSPFVSNQGSFSGSTLSCLFCGQHRKPNERVTQRVFERNQQVCEPPCAKNPKARKAAALAAQAAAAQFAGTAGADGSAVVAAGGT